METNKKAVIIVIIAVLIVIGIVAVSLKKVGKLSTGTVQPSNPVTTPAPAALDADNIARGTVASVDAKSLKITTADGERQLNIDSTTSVFSVKNKKPVKGTIADVKVGKKVNAQYDPKTMNATSILVE